MKRIAVFPGSFDPITRGHQNVVERAVTLFDEIIVAIGHNTTKQTMFPLEKRMEWIKATFSHLPNVKTDVYEGLTVEYCKKFKANYLLRGLRNGGDFEFERTIAHMNKALLAPLETVLLFTDPEYASVHSTVIREILKNNGDVSQFVPVQILGDLLPR
ncbi:MAG: pantetheine-phosphate adenylyltransferase [Crocinitomicaceae bacterium]|nr:pantetheine-phosphate adenylyltransferase [Crocinitomicaceae bacterium]